MLHPPVHKQNTATTKSNSYPLLQLSPSHSNSTILGLQGMAGNKAVQRMLAGVNHSQAKPIQRFEDGTDTIIISTLTDPKKVHDYILRKDELKITDLEFKELLDQFKTLVEAITDATLLFSYLEEKKDVKLLDEEIQVIEAQFQTLISGMDARTLHTFIGKEKTVDSPALIVMMQEQLEQLKYNKGLEIEMEEQNWSEKHVDARSDFFDRFNKEGAKYPGYSKRADYPNKRKQLDKDLKESLTREGSVGLDLESEYDEVEKNERRKKVKKNDDEYNSTLRNAMKKYDNAYSDAKPGAQDYEGTHYYQKDLSIYENEGIVGIYSQLKSIGAPDVFEYDHQPQSDIIEMAASLDISQGKKIKDIAKKHSQGGLTIVLASMRHIKGASYGKPFPQKAKMTEIDKSTDTDDVKIAKIKKMLVDATNSDALEMEAVYQNMSSYSDIDGLISDPAEAQKAKEQIRDRVLKGELKIRAQNFDDWFK